MPVIELTFDIKAPIERCFDLSRSIDLHTISTIHTGEKAIDGRTSGLIELDETVTWRAKHFGVWQNLTSKITILRYPYHFRDEMVNGAFQYFKHDHYFEKHQSHDDLKSSHDSSTKMTDRFEFESPFGLIGKLFNTTILTNYMTALLEKRNLVIKDYAESEKWKNVLQQP